MKQQKKYHVLAPLSDFFWEGNSFKSKSFLRIIKCDELPDLRGLEKELSKSEYQSIDAVKHWLTFEYEENGVLNQSNIVILFLLGLWLEIPTKSCVKQIFKFSISPPDDGRVKSFVRCLSHFQWIKGQANEDINTAHLKNALRNVELMLPIVYRRKRLWDALVMTSSGCMSYRWQVAFVCFSAAVETILTYKKGHGITKRLAKSYSCLTEHQQRDRNREYRRFIKLYGIRSDIIHGRMCRIRKTVRIRKGVKGSMRLELLADFSNLLRKLWNCILIDKSIIKELEKNDSNREIFFKKLEGGYKPPQVTIK